VRDLRHAGRTPAVGPESGELAVVGSEPFAFPRFRSAFSLCRNNMKALRGWFGEKKTTLRMWLTLDSKKYQRFHNLIIPASNGTSQIDHLLISLYGLFIVETKNIKGWIFGSENQAKWTQSLYGKKYSFQNPLRQTFRQKKILTEYLNLEEYYVQTVVFFVGDCEFKTEMPKNVLNSGLGRYIKQFNVPILSADQVKQIIEKLEQHNANTTLRTKDHIRSLKERRSSDKVCPKCGENLVERTAKKGPRAGSKFLGCENFPKCRFTKNA
jgi:restriction system protein